MRLEALVRKICELEGFDPADVDALEVLVDDVLLRHRTAARRKRLAIIHLVKRG